MSDSRSLRDLALAHKVAVIETWVAVMNDKDQPGTARIAAADKLADRMEGKAREAVSITMDADPERLTDAELALVVAGKLVVRNEDDTP